ncbi:hypothetical protein PRK78_001308 [Emydomyces testavorans]|uniref:TMEM1 family protein n=1 Tax=Emydomyces testavorans TaxID=2070801 RepID=A0AAF0IIJ1_9EURO|nr:hypothetical protein PRK78_001308 [Emydomyces testavorans]
MDASPRSSSSNPLLLQVRQLRNLHWKSPTRPLRSIGCLQIDFVPAQTGEEQKRLSDGSGGAVLHRRHQIPGLCRTPYLKIYLLRCDDNETYKTTSRKLVREWVKTRRSGFGGSQDNHDACEWLIIHVVEGNGPGPEGPEKAGPMAKWPGRGSASVLEKIKADFNGSSKNAVDRVVQLKLPKLDASQTPPEVSGQLEDLVAKLKSSILTSFDLRVAQYEEDVREKDSQRSLPGWNFCTFFILKEGLALGFENVGLYEDALIGYDELSVGLDAALRDQLSGTGDQHGGTLLAYSEEMKSRAEAALLSASMVSEKPSASNNGAGEINERPSEHITFSDPVALDQENFPFNSHKKPYRDMIVANNISVFDFRTYIFSRQMQLLLKAAQSQSSGKEGMSALQGPQSRETQDLTLIAEICDRASEFIALASRTLRRDLENGISQLEHKYARITVTDVINNLVHSWSYAAVSQVLLQTSIGSLDVPDVSLTTSKDLIDASIVAAFGSDPRPGLPQRSSSLATTPTSQVGPSSPGSHSFAFTSNPATKRPLASLKPGGATVQKPGAVELASARGDLYIHARRVLEALGCRRGWGQRWHDLSLLFNKTDSQIATFTEVPLDNDNDVSESQPLSAQASLALPTGIDTPILKEAVKSSNQFNAYYEKLTDEIFRHYVAADRIKSAEVAMADMAVLKYRQGDYGTAAPYFNQLATFYDNTRWEALEGIMLELHARCLKKLGRKEDFVRTLLQLLGKYNRMVRPKSKWASCEDLNPDPDSKVPEYICELFETSRVLPQHYTVRLEDFFTTPTIEPQIIHFKDKDGFQLRMSLRFLLAESIRIECVRVRLANSSDVQTNELWLQTPDPVIVKRTRTKILLDSSTTSQGKYFVDRIELHVGSVIFTHGFNADGTPSSMYTGFPNGGSVDEHARTFVYCYPRPEGLEAKISRPKVINLVGRKSIEVKLNSGSNTIANGVIRLKPATAGLRLLVAEVEIVNGSIQLRENIKSGQIDFSNFGPGTFATLKIPYTTESGHSTLVVRLEVEYQTDHGKFLYSTATSILTTLPVSVNVQDVFKNDVLFSRFTISPAMMIPLRVFDCQMLSSQAFAVQSSMQRGEIFDIFPKLPASLVYKIKPQGISRTASEPGSRSLRLTIDFTCLNEECLAVLEDQFLQDIEECPLSQLRCLLLPHLLQAFSSQWSANTLEKFGLLREVDVFPYERMQWQNITRTFDRKLEQQVTAWLMAWHRQHQVLPLKDKPPARAVRQIIIPVDVPAIQVVHTAELVLHNISPTQPHAAVGEAIQAELILEHTRRWCPEDKRERQSTLEFMYEIVFNPDVWLVGGRRRGNFTAAEGERRSFPLMLLPQRSGHLLLPSVEVKTFVPQEPQLEPQLTFQRRPVFSEVDYRSHGVTVLVTPNLRKTTVSLEETGPSGSGPRLIDSEPRIISAS